MTAKKTSGPSSRKETTHAWQGTLDVEGVPVTGYQCSCGATETWSLSTDRQPVDGWRDHVKAETGKDPGNPLA